jgi:hypothetical protein
VVSYCNIELKKSNTTNEIKNEILKKLKINKINGITNTYNKIRYGDKKVTEDEFVEFEREYDLMTKKCRENK